MIETNTIIIEFCTGNAVALLLFIGFLKGVARLTKNVHDDKIATLIQTLFKQVPSTSTTKR